MKTLISIVGLLFLFSCNSQDQITDPQTSSEHSLNKKPDLTAKPIPSPDATITLAINGTQIITENVEAEQDGLLTLTEGSNLISLIITSASDDPITRVSVEMRYDANVSYSIRPNAEFGGFIYRKDYAFFENQPPTSSVVVDAGWDLTLEPIASNDPTYTGNFKVTDQFSTPSGVVPDNYPTTSDHFFFRVNVSTTAGGYGVSNWKWVQNKLLPKSTFHIANIRYYGNILNKRYYELSWGVQIVDQYNNPLENAEAYYWSDEFAEGSGVGRAGVLPTNEQGWQLFTSSLTKRDFPFNRYFVGVQWYSDASEIMSVYDPGANDISLEGDPSITVNSPSDQPD